MRECDASSVVVEGAVAVDYAGAIGVLVFVLALGSTFKIYLSKLESEDYHSRGKVSIPCGEERVKNSLPPGRCVATM